jgi:hypothetical protein
MSVVGLTTLNSGLQPQLGKELGWKEDESEKAKKKKK